MQKFGIEELQELENQLENAPDAENRIDLLIELAWQIRIAQTEKSLAYCTEAETLIRQSFPDYKQKLLDCQVIYAWHHQRQLRKAEAIKLISEAETYYESIQDKKGLMRCWSVLSDVYYNSVNYTLHLEMVLKCLELAQDFGDVVELEHLHNLLGIIYYTNGEYGKSIENLNMALGFALRSIHKVGGSAVVLLNMTEVYYKMQQYTKALDYAQQARNMLQGTVFQGSLAEAFSTLGHIHEALHEYDEALACYNQKLAIGQQLDISSHISYAYSDIARLLAKQNKIDEAIQYAQLALSLAEHHDVKIAAFDALVDAYKVAGNYEKAFIYREKWMQLRDEVVNEKTRIEHNNLMIIHETKQAQLEAKSQREQAEKFRTLAENIPDSIIRIAIDGSVLYMNTTARKMLQITVADMMGRTIQDYHLPDDLKDYFRDVFEQVLCEETIYQKEYAYKTTEGYLHFDLIAVPEFASDNQAESVLFINREVTERRRAEYALKKVFEREQQNSQFIKMLLELTSSYLHELSFDEMLNYILEQLATLYHCNYTSIMLLDDNQVEMVAKRLILNSSTIDNSITEALIDIAEIPIYRQMIASNKTMELHSTTEIPVFDDIDYDVSYYLGIPLKLSGRILGFLNFYHSELNPVSPEIRLHLETIASHIAVVLYNYQLYREAKQLTIRSERQKIARDLHDVVSQYIFSASLISESLPLMIDKDVETVRTGLNELAELIKTALIEMRMLLIELQPDALLSIPMKNLIENLVESYKKRFRTIVFNLTFGCDQISLQSEEKLNLYRIIQEALTNIAKHANAKQVTLNFRCSYREFYIIIEDDGQGFSDIKISADHMGLNNMRERASESNFTFTVHSEKGKGTRIEVHNQ